VRPAMVARTLYHAPNCPKWDTRAVDPRTPKQLSAYLLGCAAALGSVTLVTLFIGLVLGQHCLRIDVPATLPPVWFDPVEVGQVVYNLVENAAKYAPPHTEISVTARRNGDAVSVAVEDHGPGIPPASLAHLFDSFYRVIDGRARPQGLGLGLAIVKGLVEAHGGRVWAENTAGGGARFTFTLPVTSVAAEVV
jgi:two-component system, OmpR family, sensor histidine kinase KdpD